MSTTIINYNVGNIQSIVNMLKRLGHTALVTSDPAAIDAATRLILPGVGSFDYGMEQLHRLGLVEVIQRKAQGSGVPFLGICLGAQLLLHKSQEGTRPGLGLVDGEVVRFKPVDTAMKVPHMGWNTVDIKKPSPLWAGLDKDSRFYFVHAYHFELASPENVLTTTHYGYDFPSSFGHKNLLGVQFHPEKSHRYGMALLKNFCEMPV